MATPPPPLSPTVATPLAHRKRRHSEINNAANGSGSGSQRPQISQSADKEKSSPGHKAPPAKDRLQVPPQQARGRSSTPAKRERSTTPASVSSSAGAKKSQGHSNGATSSPRPRPNGTAGKPGDPSRLSASPHLKRTEGRPSASPRPNGAARPSASPRPNGAARPSASPRPGISSRPSASPRPQAVVRPSASQRPKEALRRRIEDSSDEDSSDEDSDGGSDFDKSDIEDIVDSAELEPFSLITDDDKTEDHLDKEAAATLKRRLLDIGPQAFMEETLDKAKMPPFVLGTAFGINPTIYNQLGELIYMRILGQMVMRQYFKRQKLPQYNTLDDVAELLKKSSNIVVIAGAGISTSLGIPDFRSKHTGFYDRARAKAEKIGFPLSEAEEIFDIENFDQQPELFFTLAGDILPDETKFSPTHAFIKLLQDKGKLLTCYTQNIDNLEQSAGITKEKLIQCHGSFASATCRRKGVKNPAHTVPGTEIFPAIRAGQVAECKFCKKELAAEAAEKKAQEQRKKRFKLTPNKRTPTPSSFADSDEEDDALKPGVMKPDITFFGEQLPNTFFTRFTDSDCTRVDLVLVLGTSLKVAPVAEMPNYLPHKVPHVYVSREAIRHVEFDVQCLGNCDDVVVELVRKAGWTGPEGRGVLGHEMVAAEDANARVVVVEPEGDGDEGWKWRVTRRELRF